MKLKTNVPEVNHFHLSLTKESLARTGYLGTHLAGDGIEDCQTVPGNFESLVLLGIHRWWLSHQSCANPCLRRRWKRCACRQSRIAWDAGPSRPSQRRVFAVYLRDFRMSSQDFPSRGLTGQIQNPNIRPRLCLCAGGGDLVPSPRRTVGQDRI